MRRVVLAWRRRRWMTVAGAVPRLSAPWGGVLAHYWVPRSQTRFRTYVYEKELTHLLDEQIRAGKCAMSCMNLLLSKKKDRRRVPKHHDDESEVPRNEIQVSPKAKTSTRDLSLDLLNSVERLHQALHPTLNEDGVVTTTPLFDEEEEGIVTEQGQKGEKGTDVCVPRRTSRQRNAPKRIHQNHNTETNDKKENPHPVYQGKMGIVISTLEPNDVNPFNGTVARRTCTAGLEHHETKLADDEENVDDGNVLRGVYASVVKKFEESQWEALKQSLRSGSRVHVPETELTSVCERHAEAQAYALLLPLESLLTLEAVTNVNRIVRGDPAATLRDGMVRVGNNVFCEPKDVEPLLQAALQRCQEYLGMEGVNPFGLAALACMSILAIHPFSDGNGRTARIVLNCVLRHVGMIPFLVPFCKTPDTRKTFTAVVKECCNRLCVVPMANHIMEVTSDLWSDLGQAWRKQRKEVNLQSRETSVRDHRIALRRDQCSICQSETPNISTLCCGGPYHLNCLTTWLQQSLTCPLCREPMRAPNDPVPPSTEGFLLLDPFAQSYYSSEHSRIYDDDDTQSYDEDGDYDDDTQSYYEDDDYDGQFYYDDDDTQSYYEDDDYDGQFY
eukprot:PhF_6_TR34963/c2_g1_i6/m.50753